MRLNAFNSFINCLLLLLLVGCANISHPTGGDKDITPPKLVSISPEDSLLNTRVNRIEMRFDEFVSVTNTASEVHISPMLSFAPTVEAVNKRVVVKIADSLLLDNTTYRITFGKAIGDIHENNPFTGYSYIFSTGSFFDSLSIGGHITDAITGNNDTSAQVLLYDAAKSDSVIVKEKPMYAVKTDGSGHFLFEGLPNKEFRIFALRDGNGNLMYDGETEMVAFSNKTVHPADSITKPVELYIFSESDSVAAAQSSQPAGRKPAGRLANNREVPEEAAPQAVSQEGFTYTVLADTQDNKRRTVDITAPLEIVFNKPVKTVNANRINLSLDSSGTLIESTIQVVQDSIQKNKLLLQNEWKDNSLYTLRLLKNFAIDSTGAEAMPSKHTFRTKSAEDYAKLHIHLPAKYLGKQFVFVLLKDGRVHYQRPVTDTNIHFYKLEPASYSMRVILDKNENGQWDKGNLLQKLQPEKTIPYNIPVNLKAGWENIIDFEQPPANTGRKSASPNKRVAPR
jgi:nitrogen fixation protein FixH